MRAATLTAISCCILWANLGWAEAQYFGTPRTKRCVNPNQRAGTCVSLVDCQTLVSVLQRQSVHSKDVDFIKASQCNGGFGKSPHVCCTSDTGYAHQATASSAYELVPHYAAGSDEPIWQGPQLPRTILYPAGGFSSYPQPPQTQPFKPDGRGVVGARRGGGRRDLQSVRPAGSERAVGAVAHLPEVPTCGGVTIENKIYGGSDAALREFPWMALFEYRRKSGGVSMNCAGSLISMRYVLTAAHCVKGGIERRIGEIVAVRLGEHDITSQYDCDEHECAPEVLRVGIEQVIPHESYRDESANKENDIALVRLDRDIRFSDTISPVCLPSVVHVAQHQPQQQRNAEGTQLTVVGWGRTLSSSKSPIKQKLNVNLVSQERCERKFLERKVQIVETQVCAGGKYAEDSCDGDSGGPLMRFYSGVWVLEGIVSFGFRCGLKDWPAVHTRVASYDSWIRAHLRP